MIDLKKGDCLEVMKDMEDNSIDLILTDPPYELGFMGKKWDNTGIAFNVDVWKEALRVLKPGGYCMAFSGSRTYHRMAMAIEEAGFEIKDMIEWVYGSGFPKALDISKAIDKKLGKEREVVGKRTDGRYKYAVNTTLTTYANEVGASAGFSGEKYGIITAPASDLAKQYEGYKSQLKPAHEPLILAQKPIEKNFAENVMKWGTGGLNIDGCRVEHNEPLKLTKRTTKNYIYGKHENSNQDTMASANPEGRYPANLILHENIADVLDSQSGYSKSRKGKRQINKDTGLYENGIKPRPDFISGHNDEGGASRFFYNAKIEEEDYIPFCYTAKASKKERNSDIEGQVHNGLNNHATVKPKSILKYLANLGLPPYDAIVLDMFAGSGSLGLAIADINKETGRNHKAILIEKDEEHCEIIKKRCCL